MGPEKESKMWTFPNKSGDRNFCLIPEVTGIIQDLWNSGWDRQLKKPAKFFYVSRCYRYDRPQRGRYREFTQFGIEILGNKNPEQERKDAIELLQKCLSNLNIDFTLCDEIKRGIGYYVDDGFEAECAELGAQKQIAGGGRYKEGIGWAIGVDRCMLVKK